MSRRAVQPTDREAGFSLIELLVVMIIIGILAAIAIPMFMERRKQSVDSSIKSDLRTVAIHIESVYVDRQQYPSVSGGSNGANVVLEPGAEGAPFTVVNISHGNNVTGVVGQNGYCLTGSNPRGNATGQAGAPIISYNSLAGGLGDLPCPAASGL